jgi:predicted protein tyrosine phosphatase
MPRPTVLALGYSEASMLLRQPRGAGGIIGVISICGAREFAVEAADVPHRLALRFDDVDVPDPSDTVAMLRAHSRQKWASEVGRPLTPPTLADAEQIVAFARSLRDVDGGGGGTVLCHCGAGMSRSPAAALLCLATWTEPGDERWCVDELRRIRPSAIPLLGLVRLGDAVLDRQGRLTQAVVEAMRR